MRATPAAMWAHHVATEYRSALVASELLHWLLRLGTSPDTVLRCHQIVQDELRHAEMAWGLQQLAGGAGPARVPEEWATIPHAPDADLLHRALATVVAEYALSETVATALFRRLRREPLRPEVAAVVTQVARDEAVHSAFAWYALEELLPRAPDGPVWVAERLPYWVAALENQFVAIPETVDPAAQPWGCLPGSEYRRIVAGTLARVVRPRLARLGVEWAPPTV